MKKFLSQQYSGSPWWVSSWASKHWKLKISGDHRTATRRRRGSQPLTLHNGSPSLRSDADLSELCSAPHNHTNSEPIRLQHHHHHNMECFPLAVLPAPDSQQVKTPLRRGRDRTVAGGHPTIRAKGSVIASPLFPPPRQNLTQPTDAIFRVDRGRMRNLWYPKHKAEYMTAQRFAELGLSRKNDVGEREHDFRAHERAGEAAEEEPAPVPKMTAAEEAVSAYTLAVSCSLPLTQHPPRYRPLYTDLKPPIAARTHPRSPLDSDRAHHYLPPQTHPRPRSAG